MEDSGVVLLDFRALLEAAPDGIAVVDERGRILVVNEQLCALFGYEADDLVGERVEVLIPSRLRDGHVSDREQYQGSPTRRAMGPGLDLVGVRKDGVELPVEISLSPLTSGRRTFTVAIVRDISERLRLVERERELREAIAAGREWPVLASILLEAAPIGCLVVNDRAEILMANAEIEKLFGFARRELIGEKVDVLVPERLLGSHIAGREAYLTQPTVRQALTGLNLVGRRRDGTEFPVEISLSPLETDKGLFVIALARDLTESHRLQSEQEALRTLLDTEQERYRIGMDLHDGIMQDIYAVSLGLGMAEVDIDTEPVQAKDAVRHSVEQLHSVIRDIRSYIFDLRPRQFAGDLHQALFELGREFQENSSIETEVHVAPELPQIEPQVGLALYVITHEALSNTRKYAQASKVSISLFTEDSVLCLHVHDNGCGFDTSVEAPEGHRGLRNMLSRASLAGAQLNIRSAPGQGTAIRVEVRFI
ncbi:MAG: PAS domain S-box protein [Dehalococcoidia bacterium]|nr:PAS domain S-box protein [Dehalococcoidia bacterium]